MTLKEIEISIALGALDIDKIKLMSLNIDTDNDTLKYFIINNNFDFTTKLNAQKTLREKYYNSYQ